MRQSQPVGGEPPDCPSGEPPDCPGREYYDPASCVLLSLGGGAGVGGSFCYSNLSRTLTERQTVTKQFLILTYMSQLIALPRSNLKPS